MRANLFEPLHVALEGHHRPALRCAERVQQGGAAVPAAELGHGSLGKLNGRAENGLVSSELVRPVRESKL